MLEVVAELPMLALILHFVAMPMPMGSRLRWFTLAGIIRRPRAISLRISSGSIFSRPATKRISSVITPRRAQCIWDILRLPFADDCSLSRFSIHLSRNAIIPPQNARIADGDRLPDANKKYRTALRVPQLSV